MSQGAIFHRVRLGRSCVGFPPPPTPQDYELEWRTIIWFSTVCGVHFLALSLILCFLPETVVLCQSPPSASRG